jgi:anaerobic selenocysteine-containing dehydrogenase
VQEVDPGPGRRHAAADPASTFFYASGRSSNEAAFLFQTLARAYGSINIHNCSSYCHQASGVALGRMVGSGTATVVLEDLDRTDLVLLAGANPALNHPRLIVKLVELRRRGGTVIVLNPVREMGLMRFRIPSQPTSLEEDHYRGTRRRDVVMMNATDGAERGLSENDRVAVETEAGRMLVAVAFIDIPPRNLAMYYPEANILVPRRVDAESGTPALKSVAARIVR